MSILRAATLHSEIVLVPVGGTVNPVPGANGSEWVVEEFLRNTGNQSIDYFGRRCPFDPCIFRLSPGSTVSFPGGDAYTFGFVAPADNVRFTIFVRDRTKQSDTFGAQLPVVRERELKDDRVELIYVPTDRAFRRNLRLYTVRTTLEPNRVSVLRVRAYDANADLEQHERLLGEREYTVDSTNGPERESTGYLLVPNIDDLYAGDSASAVRLVVERVSGTAKIWAFVTLTNNATHHVTTVTP